MATLENESRIGSFLVPAKLRTAREDAGATPIVVRAVEIIVAMAGLVVAFPVMLLIALIVKRGTPGPAIFKQTRVGRNFKPFTLYKFRTLHADAKEKFPELYAYDFSPGEIEKLQFKTDDDPRVTPQGKWLRKSTLDELPNLWNVLVGDMALVGPRPEIPEMLPYYHGELLEKFSVRPGVTGLAQISGRGRLKFLETASLDLEYVRTRGIRTDFKILFLTVLKVVTRDGAF